MVNVGGNANDSGNTGAFYTNANNSSGNANQNIGSQLSLSGGMFFAAHKPCHAPAWQNTKQCLNGVGRETEGSEVK